MYSYSYRYVYMYNTVLRARHLSGSTYCWD